MNKRKRSSFILVILLLSSAVEAQPRKKPTNVIYGLEERIKQRQEACKTSLQSDDEVLPIDSYGGGDEKGNLTFRLGKQKVVLSVHGRRSEIKRVLRVLRFYSEKRLTEKLRAVHCAGLKIVTFRLSNSMTMPFTDDEVRDYSELLLLSLQKVPPLQGGACLSNLIYTLPAFTIIGNSAISYLFLSITLASLPMHEAIALHPEFYWKLVQQWYHFKHAREMNSPYDEEIQTEIGRNAIFYRDLVPYVR